MNRLLRTAALYFVVQVAPAPGVAFAAENVQVTVGGQSISIPPPAGFVRIDGVNATFDSARKGFIAPTNRFLAYFAGPEVLASLQAGEFVNVMPNFNVQVLRQLESTEVGERTFEGLRNEMKSGMGNLTENLDSDLRKLADQGSASLKEDLGVDAKVNLGGTRFAGIFEDQTTSLGFTMIISGEARSQEKVQDLHGVVACIMTPVNGRLLYLYATRQMDSKDDQSRAENEVKAWRDAVVVANPRVAGPEAPSGPLQQILRTTLIGAAIGLAIGAIRALSLKWGKKNAAA